MATPTETDSTAKTLKRWKDKRGSLIMALHEIQDQQGYVPRESAFALAESMDVPLARIYEVLTFYNYFKLTPPGKAVVSVCTGTACYLKGAGTLVKTFKQELSIETEETTSDGLFYLQTVRCVGCCGLAPVVVVNGKTYGKVKPEQVKQIIGEWQDFFQKGA